MGSLSVAGRALSLGHGWTKSSGYTEVAKDWIKKERFNHDIQNNSDFEMYPINGITKRKRKRVK
jgi:hypothetical protein